MKKLCSTILALTIAAFLVSSCKEEKANTDSNISTDVVTNPVTASGTAPQGAMPVFTPNEEVHDFGPVTQGEKVKHTFKFKNTGGTDLVISSAKGTCGCTVADYPKKPIPPGGEGGIDVVFDSNSQSGKVSKSVTVITNAQPNTYALTFTANVKVPEDKATNK